jgi:TPR repeat protein
MTNIGILYYNAQGVKRDLVQAYAWFGRAQKLGDPRAAELVKTTAEKLRPGDLRKAETLAAQWNPPKPAQPQTAPAEAVLFAPPPKTPEAAPAAGPAVVPKAGRRPLRWLPPGKGSRGSSPSATFMAITNSSRECCYPRD